MGKNPCHRNNRLSTVKISVKFPRVIDDTKPEPLRENDDVERARTIPPCRNAKPQVRVRIED